MFGWFFVGFIANRPTLSIGVEVIPDQVYNLMNDKGSVHASSVLDKGTDQESGIVLSWIQDYIVSPVPFELNLSLANDDDAQDGFVNNSYRFQELNYVVWDVQHDQDATCRLKFYEIDQPHRCFTLSGCPDYLITPVLDSNAAPITKSNFLQYTRGIIEIQSKEKDEDMFKCEIQIQLYLTLMMNLGLQSLVGFLVQRDNQCRTYKAKRNAGGIIYEQNDLVHVSELAGIFHQLWQSGSMN